MVQGVKRIDVFTNKFGVGQRVRNVRNGYTCTILAVDPKSFNPPQGKARHNPYQVQYEHLVTPRTAWIPEQELELLDE